MLEAPENSPEEAENAPGIAAAEGEAAQQKMQIVAICFAHGGWRVVGGEHGLGDDAGEEVEVA